MKTIYLTSSLNANYKIFENGEEVKKACKIDNSYHIVDCLKEDVKGLLNFVMICSNPTNNGLNDMYANLIKQSFVLSGFTFQSFVCIDDRNCNEIESYIKNANFVYLCGGHVPTENAFFNEINLKDLLEDFDGIIMGQSAGSMNMAETVYAQAEEDGESVNPKYKWWLSGLNLTNITCLPHYESTKDIVRDDNLSVKEMAYRDSFVHKITLFSDGNFIRVKNGKKEYYGEIYEIENGERKLVGYKKDLHIHTKYSDGEFDEYEIVEKVVGEQIKEFCICDHDTIEGSQKVSKVVKEKYPELIFHSGIELSCRISEMFGGINVHILARDFDYSNEHIKCYVEEMKQKRIEKAYRVRDAVKQLFDVFIPDEEIDEKLKTTNSFGKPHIYALLLKHKNVERAEFFDKLNKFQNADLKLDIKKVISQLKEDGCQITLAHPIEVMEEYNLTYDQIEEVIKYLTNLGINALETKHSKISHQDNDIFSNMAKKYNLTETCGSDYHGPIVKPHVHLAGIYKD